MGRTKQDEALELLKVLHDWHQDHAMQTCPKCGGETLLIRDLSARPHMEWYRFSCRECGFEETVSRPLASPGQSGIN